MNIICLFIEYLKIYFFLLFFGHQPCSFCHFWTAPSLTEGQTPSHTLDWRAVGFCVVDRLKCIIWRFCRKLVRYGDWSEKGIEQDTSRCWQGYHSLSHIGSLRASILKCLKLQRQKKYITIFIA